MEQDLIQELTGIKEPQNITSHSGLGMILVREFLEKNNSKLEIESEPEKGSTFIINI